MQHSFCRLVVVTFTAFALLPTAAGPARAQESTAMQSHGPTGGGDIGLGASAFLPQAFGVNPAAPAGLFVYDTGAWRVDALLGASNFGNNVNLHLLAGARFWYLLHQGDSSDLSVGGGLGFSHLDVDTPMGLGIGAPEDVTSLLVEAGLQLRVFLTSNVALSGSLGIGFRVGEESQEGLVLGSQLMSSLGVAYFLR